MSKTQENLKNAFAGESQANRKYLAFAAQADKEGLTQVAKLFRAVAEAETIHAHAHLRLMKGIGTTEENLRAANEGEVYEYESMYPAMIKDAEDEGNRAAARYFDFANQVEELHSGLYTEALNDPAGLEGVDYYVCSVCGNTVKGQPSEKCSVCNVAPDKFFKSE
jgi:rubrerythrin